MARRGITLIEVVASITLMSLLLTGILLAFARHHEQLRRAEILKSACAESENLFASWMESSTGIPQFGTGVFGDEGQYMWNNRLVTGSQPTSRVPFHLIEVSIRETNNVGRRGNLFSVTLMDSVQPVSEVR